MLGTTALGDADLIVTLLSEHSGRVRGVARSARRSRVRFGGALAPMTRVRARWTERHGRELHRIEGVDLLRSFAPMQAEPIVQAACALFAETGMVAIREDQDEPATFRLYGAVLEALEAGLDPWCAVRYFEFWILRLHGVLADLDACVVCGRRVPATGACAAVPAEGLACGLCAASQTDAVRLGAADRNALATFVAAPPGGSGSAAARCLPSAPLARYLRLSIERFLERRPKAYRHLEAMA